MADGPGSGHLHVVAGDLNQIHCDAVLIPSDGTFALSGDFEPTVSSRDLEALSWSAPVIPVPGRREPLVFVGDVGRAKGADPSFLAAVVESFVAGARVALSGPEIPLLCLPVLGTGRGGFADDQGEIYELLLPALVHSARTHGVDLVLVCRGRRAYAAAQRSRLGHLISTHGDPSLAWDIDEHLRAAALRLSEHASLANLVLFLGAGVSAGSGVPLWQALLDRIAGGLEEPMDLELLHRLDLRDQAALIERRMGEGDLGLSRRVVEAVDASRYSVAHGLLANLRNGEAVTTNYDRLFERAVEASGDDLAVLPYEPVRSGERWLLKLHGTVDRPDSIVLTRRDYLGMPQAHGALFGLVQAMLLTRHMLFVGYSLSDEDFHQLIHEVRLARPNETSTAPPKLGTVLTLYDDRLFEELWADDVEMVAMGHRPPADASADAKAVVQQAVERRLRLLLDLVAFLSADLGTFLLDDRFSGLLDEAEVKLASALATLRAAADGDKPVQLRIAKIIDDLTADRRTDRLQQRSAAGSEEGDVLQRLARTCPPETELRTLGRGKPNWIVAVDDSGVLIHTERSKGAGDPQLVDAWMLRDAWEHLRAYGSLSNRYLVAADGLNVKRSSAVCTLLATLPEVKVASTSPVVLAWAAL